MLLLGLYNACKWAVNTTSRNILKSMSTDPDNLTRTIWFAVGMLSLLLAFAGVFLPLLPTTPFLLVSVYAFARSSPGMHHWLMSHRKFGPLIRDWQQHRAIDRRTKRIALFVILVTAFIGAISDIPFWMFCLQVAVLAMAAFFIVTRPDSQAVRKQGPD